jgi:hypothetical protein
LLPVAILSPEGPLLAGSSYSHHRKSRMVNNC